MGGVNDILADKAVARALDLQHYSNDVVRRIISLLNKVDGDLVNALRDALDRLPPASFTVERLEKLLKSVRQLNAQAYGQASKELTNELGKFVRVEASYQLELFRAAIPAQVVIEVGLTAVNAQQVYTAAMARPFQGRLLNEWAASIEQGRMIRIRDAVRMGYVEGQTTDEIVRRVRGTVAKGYQDGIIEIDRRHARSIVQTAIAHMAGVTRESFDEANSDLIKGYQWLSTLDTKTSDPCRIRDRKQYDRDRKPVGHSVPWLAGPGRLHWCCRSCETRILKSLRELGLNVDDFQASARASMDGQVPADTNYSDWLEKQPSHRQDEILGPVRAQLMRDGKVKPDQLYTSKGRYLTLDELAARGIS